MKSYLFYFLLFFPLGLAFSQTLKETNVNTNSTNNSIQIPKQELKKENTPAIEKVQTKATEPETESVAKPEMLAPASRMPIDAAATQSTSFAAQKAIYLNQFNTYSQQRNQRSFTTEQSQKVEESLRNLSAIQPGSFESYLFYYMNGQNDLTRAKALLKAKEMRANDPLVQKELMNYYVLMNNADELRKVLLDVSQADVYDESVENYGDDMMKSVPANGVLITHGDEDSYAGMYAQKVKRVREDIQILSLDWLTSPQFRTNLIIKGWKLPEGNFIDTQYLAKLCALNPEKKIAISMTLPKEYLLPILDKLYVSGLVFDYLDVPTDLTLTNEKLWNERFNKKVITQKDQDLSKNYLPMLYQLKKVYQENGNSKALNNMESQIQEILKRQ